MPLAVICPRTLLLLCIVAYCSTNEHEWNDDIIPELSSNKPALLGNGDATTALAQKSQAETLWDNVFAGRQGKKSIRLPHAKNVKAPRLYRPKASQINQFWVVDGEGNKGTYRWFFEPEKGPYSLRVVNLDPTTATDFTEPVTRLLEAWLERAAECVFTWTMANPVSLTAKEIWEKMVAQAERNSRVRSIEKGHFEGQFKCLTLAKDDQTCVRRSYTNLEGTPEVPSFGSYKSRTYNTLVTSQAKPSKKIAEKAISAEQVYSWTFSHGVLTVTRVPELFNPCRNTQALGEALKRAIEACHYG